ncbi:hypothetical protein PLICRDRAFT_45548 [Plicaturopsis crispa FD-325 SS-3]|uniref:SET domain-containing protein n=1 Tax=Plicaturopsis crispa FD-325 SS-3 TaxID=944288 RepID=A0A0C9SL24_PLICR|nr:hypothetical protein PLICRDRAFT_45548 [Plicaturopsis crispa FD-325 SS-3]
MKRGFLKNGTRSQKQFGDKPPSPVRAPQSTPSSQSAAIMNTTCVYSTSPCIVRADIRLPESSHFLYLPAGRPADMVFVDTLASVKKIAKWPVWSQPPPVMPSPRPFRVELAPGKGVGMFANRLIKAGELIMMERPVYASRRRRYCAPDQNEANGIFHRAAISGLSGSSRQALMALKNSYGSDYDVVFGILTTNFLPIDITEEPDPDNDFLGCFPTLSRANHDCCPSANYFFSFAPYCGQFWAVRDIPKDAEITISYASLVASRAERQKRLLDIHKFTCTCNTCTLPAQAVQRSDARREEIAEISARSATSAASTGMSKKRVLNAMKYVEEEGLVAASVQMQMYAASFFMHQLDFAEGVRWMKKAKKSMLTVEGEDSYGLKAFKGLDPVLS